MVEITKLTVDNLVGLTWIQSLNKTIDNKGTRVEKNTRKEALFTHIVQLKRSIGWH